MGINRMITIFLTILSVFILLTACSSNVNNNAQPATTEDGEEQQKDMTEDKNITPPKEELQKFDSGDNVKILQQTLNQIGYDIPVTGDYDEATTWAITDFQLQNEELLAIGVYDKNTKNVLQGYLENEKTIKAGLGLPQKDEMVSTSSGASVIANPYDQLAVINKEFALPGDYEPEDLVIPNVRFPFTEDLPKKQLRQVAADALEELFEAADQEGLELFAQSGYRSFERQEEIFAYNANTHGEEHANTFSARAGESEHQSGLSMDVTNSEVNFDLITEFGETDEGKWLRENAADYGFIIRFPEGKEEITKYQYEPWHLRYVGVRAAKDIMENNITLEEYVLGDEK